WAIREAKRVLKPQGCFYSFEPDDHFLVFPESKKALHQVVALWQKKVGELGLDPFVGRRIYPILCAQGFQRVQTRLLTKVSTGGDPQIYQKHLGNLEKIFLSRGPEFLGLRSKDPLWQNALLEFHSCSAGELMVEGYFIHLGFKEEADVG
ncbi:MAG: hypothetical protein ACO3A2_11080, partial [Bdellovibrionia bacterium]